MTYSSRVFLMAAIFFSGVGIMGCNRPGADGPGGEQPPLVVKVSPPVVKAVTDYADFTGRTAAVESVKLRARVWGHLEEIIFKEGANVQKGDLLFVIDQRPYQAAVARTEADVAQSEARKKRLAGDQKRAQALLDSNSLSKEEFEKINGDYLEAVAALRSAEASRDVAKLNLEFTKVTAPITGQISRAMVTVGNMVESGETGGTMLTSIVSIDPIHAYFDVDDQSALPIRDLLRKSTADAQSKLYLGLTSEKGFPHEGKLDFVDNQVDAGTGTLRMRGIFTNANRTLTPGLFVRIRVPLGKSHDAVLVSDRAIDTDQGQKVVFVVNAANVVEKRLVELRGVHDGLREIASGVKAGELVVVEGIQRVRDGVTVAPLRIEK